LLVDAESLTSELAMAVTVEEATLTKFLPRMLYLLPARYLGLLTSATESLVTDLRVKLVLWGGLISGYPGMGIFYIMSMLLIELVKRREEEETPPYHY
jgi:hypothetical protein